MNDADMFEYSRRNNVPLYHFAPMAYWDDKVFDMMNYLVGRYGPCEIEHASESSGITAVFKGRYRVSIRSDGVTEWLTEDPPNA